MFDDPVLIAACVGAFGSVATFSWVGLRWAGLTLAAERSARAEARSAFVARDATLSLLYPILVLATPMGRHLLVGPLAGLAGRAFERMGLHEEEMDLGLMGAICLVSALAGASMLSLLGVFFGVYWLGILGLVPAGYLPLSMLDAYARERQLGISRRYPFFLDLVALAMKAGATFRQSCELYVEDNPGLSLGGELGAMLRNMDRGKSEQEALREFASRVQEPAIAESVAIIVQGQELGTPLAMLIEHQAQLMRHERLTRAERLAEEAAVRMTGPTTVMMIASLILIIGPMILDAARSGIF